MSLQEIRGRVWIFGDNISTDLIMPNFSYTGGVPAAEIPLYSMHPNRPGWSREVQPGDIIVAGKNFGCGSSRPAPDNLKALGIGCVIASSLGGIFYRNAITAGLLVMEVPDAPALFEEGDQAVVDPRSGAVTNSRTGQTRQVPPLPDLLFHIAAAGGVVNMLRREYGRV